MENSRLIALFDMDDTLCDTMGQLKRDLAKRVSAEEFSQFKPYSEKSTPNIKSKIKEIRNRPNWWRNLPRLQAGFDILNITTELGFENYIVTKGPYKIDMAFSEKRQWQKRELPDLKLIITDDKSIIQGNVLIDDWPPYLRSWIDNNPRGKAIMPLTEYNKNFNHSDILTYDGSNLQQVRKFLQVIKSEASKY